MSLTEASTWQQIITSMLESLDAIELVEPPSYLIEINAITVDDAVKYSKIKSGLKALAAKGSGITLDEVLELVCYYQWTLEYSTLSVGSTAWQQGLDRFRECLRDPESNLMVSKTLQVYMGGSVKRAPATYENLLRAVIAREELKKAEAARKEKAIKELQQRINEMQQQLDALQNGGGGGVDGGGGTSPTPPADMGGGSGGGGKGGGGGVKVGELELVQF